MVNCLMTCLLFFFFLFLCSSDTTGQLNNSNKNCSSTPQACLSNASSLSPKTLFTVIFLKQFPDNSRCLFLLLLLLFIQLCQTLCDPMDCIPSGSSVRGILQVKILECVAIFSSRESSQLTDETHISCSSCIGRWILPLSHLGGPSAY